MFIDSLARAGFQASLLDLRNLDSWRDIRTRRFLLSSNTTHEDIREDLFDGGEVALQGAGGVMRVSWIEDTVAVRRDVTALLQSPQVETIFTGGTFVVLEIAYDPLVLPLFELYEMVVMSSSNRLHISVFPSSIFIHRHSDRESLPPSPTASSLGGQAASCEDLGAGPGASAGASAGVTAAKQLQEDYMYIQTQCGICCALTAILLLITIYSKCSIA